MQSYFCRHVDLLLAAIKQSISHNGAGAPGMPQLSDQELLEQTIQTAGSSVSRGKVRRKKEGVRRGGRGGLAELTRLR